MGKILFAILASMAFQSAFAEDAVTSFEMPKGLHTLYLIDGVQMVGVEVVTPKCKPNERCAMTTRANLEVPLSGCLDSLGPVTVQQFNEDGKIVLAVTALGVLNPASRVAFCSGPRTHKFQVTVGFGVIAKERIEVRTASELYNN